MSRGVRGVKYETRDALEAEALGGKYYKSWGYVDD